jgi:RHS repeat-associated protein
MSGDTVKLGVQSYYNTGSGTTNNSSFTDVLNSLAGGLVNVTGGSHGGLTNFTANNSSVYTGLGTFLTTDETTPSGYPKAYLNWIFLDDQFNYVSSLSNSVPAASSTYPAGQLNTIAPGSQLALNKNGYLYIWVSNETQGWDVFFDNLSVQYKQGPVLEENHYYPFGLTMAGISDKALKTQYVENKYKYNGIEYDSTFGIDEYEAHYRDLDPQTGRWWQIDPQTEGYEYISPYASMYDDPPAKSDPLGDEAESGCCKELLEAVETVVGIAAYSISPHSPTAEGTRRVIVSAGSTMNGMLNTATAGAWPTDPAGTLGVPSETNASATMYGQLGGMFIDPGTGSLDLNITSAPADGVSLFAAPKVASPGLPSVKVDATSNNQGSGEGRGSNNRKPDPKATGDHTVSDANGSTTYQKNNKNPSGFQEIKRVDTKGSAHGGVQTPHVHTPGKKLPTPAKPEDIPKTDLSKNKPPTTQ